LSFARKKSITTTKSLIIVQNMYLSQLSLDNVCEDTPTIVFTNDYFTTYGGMIHGQILKPNSHSRS
jgi:hypothetical protein